MMGMNGNAGSGRKNGNGWSGMAEKEARGGAGRSGGIRGAEQMAGGRKSGGAGETALPIDAVIGEVKAALAAGKSAVLVAAPGAGKTTRVPLALLDEPWLAGRKIVMLEPRRLAARAAAAFMAARLGERPGGTVGYRVRQDTKAGPRTRIEVITEGILTRMLQRDPALEEVGLVIFDEFHERSIHADLGLALALESQSVLRHDLRLLVMSATLEAEPVSALMDGTPVVVSEGRHYPVETRYLPPASSAERLEEHAVRAVLTALDCDEGDILVFLPGAGEIRAVEARLAGPLQGRAVDVRPLFGAMPQEAQDAALRPGEGGRRKIVLATTIAETSLTVEGVRIVVDCGLARVPRFSPRTGMSRLETVRVSRASADQRRGRAGRLEPGVCYRLWSEEADRGLAPSGSPEIAEADLAPLALELCAWGVREPASLRFLTPPPAAVYRQALELLDELGAVDGSGQLTAHGRRMADTGLHPRLAHMVLRGAELGLGALACDAAALLEERDLLQAQPGRAAPADFELRLEALRRGGAAPGGWQADPAAVRRVAAAAAEHRRTLGLDREGDKAGGGAAAAGREAYAGRDRAGLLLAFAYPDRIGMLRGNGAYVLRGGRGAAFPSIQPLSASRFIVAAELDDQGADGRIRLASELLPETLAAFFADDIREERLVGWDRAAGAVRVRIRRRLGAIVLEEIPAPASDPEETADALLAGIREEGLGLLPWTKAARQLQQRLLFMHAADPAEWPDASDEALLDSLEDWLGPHVYGMKSRADLQRVQMVAALESLLSWDRRRELDEAAPTHLTVPSGSRIPVDYSDPAAPALAVRLQELFGLPRTPLLGKGRVPVTLHLLSPAQRPVQVTRDLASFWREAYFEVKKDLKGRYPKHYWPDDPLEAAPTSRAKPRQ